MSNAPVLFEELAVGDGRRIGIATLNAERSLHALTLEMVDLLNERLIAWENDSGIVCVIVRGSGDRALCAGGDVVRLSQPAAPSVAAGTGDTYVAQFEAAKFFEREYRLDYRIHTYGKPVMVWGHGVVMGGGLGILAGASHRVVTGQTRMAMPEVTIGLYPDVGASFFLQRMPGRTGLFLALTGAAINASDALFAGLADRFIQHAFYAELVQALQNADWSGRPAHAVLSSVLRSFEARSGERPASELRRHYDWIAAVTDGDELCEVVDRICAYRGDDPWLKRAVATLEAGCPTTLYLIWEQLRRSRHLSLREAFQLELIISCNCALRPNFREGVRALLVDKDRAPRFQPASLGAVEPDWIEEHFQPPWGDGPHPLADL